MEAIDEKLVAHNADASAHGLTDEAVHTHRTDQLFDHPQYSVYNIKMAPSTRTVKAFCDIGGAAEFEDIQEAIDYVHAVGGGTVFIKAGTYSLSSNINLYSDIELLGEDDDTTILDFGGNMAVILAFGTVANPMRNIRIRNLCVKNSLDGVYGGITFDYVFDSIIERCKFDGNINPPNGSCDIDFIDSQRIRVQDCRSVNGGAFLWLIRCDHITIDSCNVDGKDFGDATYTCVEVWVSPNTSFIRNRFESYAMNCIIIHSDSSDAVIIGNFIFEHDGFAIVFGGVDYFIISDNVIVSESATYDGIAFSASTRCLISGNIIRDAGGDGIVFDTSDDSIIDGNIITGCGGWGVNITDAASDRNLIHGNNLRGNTAGTLNDAGTNTVAADNVV